MSKDTCNTCNLSGISPLVNCAVCKESYHIKCIAPNSTIKDFDALLTTPGFYFYCKNHHHLSVHNLIKRLSSIEEKFKKCFSDVNEELTQFHKSIQDCGMQDLPTVDDSTPIGNAPQPEVVNEPTVTKKALLPEEKSSRVTTRNQHLKRKNGEAVSNDEAKRLKNLSTTVGDVRVNGTGSNGTPLNSVESSPEVVVVSDTDVPSGPVNEVSFAAVVQGGISSERDEGVAKVVQQPFGFTAVPPVKKIFVSRLPPDITTETIRAHVLSRLNCPNMFLNVTKLPLREGAQYSSMILNLGHNEDHFETILKDSFWPRNTVVHPDIPREMRASRPPQQSKSKN